MIGSICSSFESRIKRKEDLIFFKSGSFILKVSFLFELYVSIGIRDFSKVCSLLNPSLDEQ